MKIINSSFCENEDLAVEKLVETQLCVTYKDLAADTCQGDSGSPIQNIIDAGYEDGGVDIYRVVGITSFGSAICGSDIPSVNTKVSSYINWIEQIVWSQYFDRFIW
jgi:secreted trypsin-like serine protease